MSPVLDRLVSIVAEVRASDSRLVGFLTQAPGKNWCLLVDDSTAAWITQRRIGPSEAASAKSRILRYSIFACVAHALTLRTSRIACLDQTLHRRSVGATWSATCARNRELRRGSRCGAYSLENRDERTKHLARESLETPVRRLEQNLTALTQSRVCLFSHLGLGDQIAIAPAIEAWARRATEVVVLAAPANIRQVSEFYTYLPNVTFAEVPSQSLAEAEEIAERLGCGLVEGGRQMLRHSSAAFPELGLNGLLCAGLLVFPTQLSSLDFRSNLLSGMQEEPPAEPYVFIDDRPGSPRRIPDRYLEAALSLGLPVVTNSPHLPLASQGAIINQAEHLYMCVSAPACLALTANLGPTRRVLFSNRSYFLMNDYPGWDHNLVWNGQKLEKRHSIDRRPVNLRIGMVQRIRRARREIIKIEAAAS